MKKICLSLICILFISVSCFATLTMVISSSPASCPGVNNGTITVTVTSGVAPYQYTLNGLSSGSSGNFTGLAAGNYTVNVVDAMGDAATANALIVTAGVLTQSTISAMLCTNQLPYQFNGTNIYSAGVYAHTLTNMTGCDSIVTLFLSVTNTSEWIGSSNTSWENPANWSCGAVPGPATDVVINSGTVVVHANTTIYSLTVSPDASLTVSTGVNLIVIH